MRAEYARSFDGSGYWAEGSYRLSQVHSWHKAMRRTEVVARMQQFYVGNESSDGLPGVNTRETDFGVNYFNQWTYGLAYRWLLPLGKVGAP